MNRLPILLPCVHISYVTNSNSSNMFEKLVSEGHIEGPCCSNKLGGWWFRYLRRNSTPEDLCYHDPLYIKWLLVCSWRSNITHKKQSSILNWFYFANKNPKSHLIAPFLNLSRSRMLLSLLNFTDLNGIPFQKKRPFTCKYVITGIGKYSKKIFFWTAFRNTFRKKFLAVVVLICEKP